MTRSNGRAFNEWLRAQLKAKKMSQRQLAQQSGVYHSTISRLVRGDRMPSLGTATKLARSSEGSIVRTSTSIRRAYAAGSPSNTSASGASGPTSGHAIANVSADRMSGHRSCGNSSRS